MSRRLYLLLLFALPAPLSGQALAREDIHLLNVTQGDDRTRQDLTLGRAALERATSTGEASSYQEAVFRFEEAALRSPDLAEPWFGLALSRLALFESGAASLNTPTQPLGGGNRAAWASHIRAALARDPRHVGALTSLEHVVLPQGDREQPGWLRDAIARAESLGVTTPELALIRGRLARQERRYEEAAASFREYASRGGDPSVAALEEARALAATDDLDAAAARYDSGLAVLTDAGWALYRQDLELIAEPEELAPLRATSRADAPAWVHRFWLRRDAADVRTEGEREREHLRRWAVANERYRVVDPDRRLLFHEPWAPIAPCVPRDSFDLAQSGAHEAADSLDARRAERILDDRGLMYLRHGEPLRVVWTLGATDRDFREAVNADKEELRREELPRNVAEAELALRAKVRSLDEFGGNSAEVWTYFIDGRVRSYLFRGSRYLGLDAPTTLTSDISSPELALLRAQLDPRFFDVWNRYNTPFQSKVPVACMVTVQRLARDVRSDLMLGGSTDDDPLFFPVPVIPAVQVAAVGDAAHGNGRVVVAYAMPGDRLASARIDGTFVYPLRWRLTAVAANGEIRRAEGDLTRTTRDSLVAGQFLSDTLSLPIAAGTWRVGVALFQPDEQRGGAIEARAVQLDSGTVTMSDLLLGREEERVQWNGIPINPLGTWRRATPMTVAAELRGVPAGTPLTTVIEVRQVDRTRSAPLVRVSASDLSDGPTAVLRRLVDLHTLHPGIYQVSVEVRTPDGVVGHRAREFEVIADP